MERRTVRSRLWSRAAALNARLGRMDRPVAYWITTLVLVVWAVGTATALLDLNLNVRYGVKVTPSGDVDYTFERAPVTYDGVIDLAQVAPDLEDRLPPGVTSWGGLPVQVAADRSLAGVARLGRLSTAPMALLVLAIVWLVRRIVLSTVGPLPSGTHPFVRANVWRLRAIAVIVLLMPGVELWSDVAQWEVVSRSLTPDVSMFWHDASHWPAQLGVGVLVWILSDVFNAGVRMRDDVEGLV